MIQDQRRGSETWHARHLNIQPGRMMKTLCFLFMQMSVLTGLPQYLNLTRKEDSGKIKITCSKTSIIQKQSVEYQWYKNLHDQWSLCEQGETVEGTASEKHKFFCLASSEDHTYQSAAVSLMAFSPPIVSISQDVTRGKPSLRCTATCNPEATEYVWFLNGTKYNKQPGEVLIFWNIQKSDRGNYTCNAKNQLGNADSHKFELNVTTGKVDKDPHGKVDKDPHKPSDEFKGVLILIIGLVLCVAAVAACVAVWAWWRSKLIILKRQDSTTRVLMKTIDEEKGDGEKGIYASVEAGQSAGADKDKGLYAKLDVATKESEYDAIKGPGSDGGEGKGIYTGLTVHASQSDYEVLKQKEESGL